MQRVCPWANPLFYVMLAPDGVIAGPIRKGETNMKNKRFKRAIAGMLAGALLTGTAYGAAQYDSVDPANPYQPPVSGMFHEQQINADGVTGQYSVYIADEFEPCSDGIMVLTPDGVTAKEFLNTDIGQDWIRLADEKGIAIIAVEPQDGQTWNLSDAADERDDEAFLKTVYNTIRNKSQSVTAAFDMNERAFYLVGYEEGATAAQEFAMEWSSLFAGVAAVGGSDVPDTVEQETGDALSYPFAEAESLEGQTELQIPNREVPVPVWLIDAEDTGLTVDYWVAASDAKSTEPGDYAQQAYANDAVRVWLTDSEHADGITPAVLYESFLSQVQRFVGTPGGRLEWTVAHTNDGETGFFVTEQMMDGKLRRWMTYVPSSYREGTEVPLVVAVHGYSSSMTAFTGDSRWQDVAEENGFIVVFAQGYPTEVMGNIPVPFWNNELMGMEVADPTDDVSYFRALVAQTQENYSIDASRIYATGHSNGSCEVWLLAMEMSDVFAAYAPIGSDMGGYKDTVEITTDPIPVWNMKSEYDTDGAAKLEPGSTDALTIDYWTSYNGTSKEPEITTDESGIFVTRNYYDANGIPLVRFSEVSDAPHAYTPEISEIVWDDFFSKITLNEDGSRIYDGQKIERTTTFTDIAADAYYADAVTWAVDNDITNGLTATTFGPDETVSRAQMVTFLWRAAGSPEAAGDNPFTDIAESDYYYDAVLWAVENGITNGTTATAFSPEDPVSRAQAVTFQWRADGSPAASGSSFDDVSADAYYAAAVAWAVEHGITNGETATTFEPETAVSRAQAVTFLYRAEQ